MTVVVGQHACLPNEACWYEGADWLSLAVSQRMATGQLLFFVLNGLQQKREEMHALFSVSLR